jgi:hypothetical protein
MRFGDGCKGNHHGKCLHQVRGVFARGIRGAERGPSVHSQQGELSRRRSFHVPRGKHTRKNVSKNRINQKYWYRYRARAIITGFRYLVATGCLMPEQRGKCKGTSLIHDPHVRDFCFVVGYCLIWKCEVEFVWWPPSLIRLPVSTLHCVSR